MLAACNLTVRFGRRTVLDAVDLTAAAGAITAIVGPNGSGKSTLLRALTGEIRAEGRVSLDGVPIDRMSAGDLARRRAVLAQSNGLAFPYTVGQVVSLGLRAGSASGRADVVREALATVGLVRAEHRVIHDLSGGEQQRVHLARVLAQVWDPVGPDGPRWLFLDEPVSSLDIAHQLQVMGAAARFAAQGGGVVCILHDLNLTALHAHRTLVLSEGRVLAEGRTPEVLTDAILSRAYGCRLFVGKVPEDGGPFLLPQACEVASWA